MRLIKSNRRRGFTLLEILIVILLIALAMAVGIPSFNALTFARLRKASVQLAGTIRFLYSQAAIKSRCMRISFDIKGDSYRVEEAVDGFCLIDREQKSAFQAKREEEEKLRKLKESAQKSEQETAGELLNQWWDGDKKVQFRLKETVFQEVSGGRILRSRRLPDGVEFDGIFVEHQKEVYTKERGPNFAYFHCFPLGLCQRAVIYLKNKAGVIFSLEVKPLTGKVVIHRKKLELSERFLDRGKGDDDYSAF